MYTPAVPAPLSGAASHLVAAGDHPPALGVPEEVKMLYSTSERLLLFALKLTIVLYLVKLTKKPHLELLHAPQHACDPLITCAASEHT